MALKKIMAMILAIALSGVAAIYLLQRKLLFAADKTLATPAELNLLNTETVSLKTSDGVRISAWLSRTKGSRRLVIYFHGNGGSLAWRASTIRRLRNFGLSVLSVEYRGYGDTEGSPSETGLERDAEAAYDYALRLGYGPQQILLHGESLGSGVAITLASHHAVGGLILDSPFTSVSDVAAAKFWMLPVRWLIRDPFWSSRRIRSIKAPILILHGTQDRVIPIRFGRELFSMAGPDATFVEVEGGQHIALDEESVQPSVRKWLEELPAIPASDSHGSR